MRRGRKDREKAEAKKIRQQRNAVTADRDAWRERAQRLQRREVERVAAETLHQPEDFWLLVGDDITPWLTDDGEVNADAVRARAAEETGKRPGMARVERRRDPDQGKGASTERQPPSIGEWMSQARR